MSKTVVFASFKLKSFFEVCCHVSKPILFKHYHKHHDSTKNKGSMSYLKQTGEMEMDNSPSFTIFRGFSIFLGLFTSFFSYFDPQIALKSRNNLTWWIMLHSIIIYIPKANWRDGDG